MEPVSPLRPGSSTPNIAGLGSLHVPSPDYSLSPSAFKISQSQSPDATISSPTLKLPSGGYGYSGSSFPLNFNSGQELSTEVQRKAAEWERQIESLDAKELEIHQTQLRLIREQTAAFRSDFTALRKELADTKAIVQRQQASANEQGAWRNISWLDDLFARERQERGKAAVFSLERPKLRDEISGLKTLLRRSLDFMLTNVSAFTTGASARVADLNDAASAANLLMEGRTDAWWSAQLERWLGDEPDGARVIRVIWGWWHRRPWRYSRGARRHQRRGADRASHRRCAWWGGDANGTSDDEDQKSDVAKSDGCKAPMPSGPPTPKSSRHTGGLLCPAD
ncbi:unnamed protein product [Symbiodinium sp. KB8]|nr:unnamed protein product [Symbiodinium sp. KB8]